MGTKDQFKRVEALEKALQPDPVNVFVHIAPHHAAFPVNLSENRARAYAWHSILKEYQDRAAAEAEASYDRTQFAGFCSVQVLPFLNIDQIGKQFQQELEAGKFTASEYLAELGAATTWSERNGYPAPENYLDSIQDEEKRNTEETGI